jgi:hypothetical protein
MKEYIPSEIKEFYNSMENIESLNIWNIQDELKPIEKLDKKWRKKIAIERKILTYNLSKGKLHSNSQITDEFGKVKEISFNADEIDYLKERLDEVSNSWLKARYSHLIWQSTMHNDYAGIAINNYKLSIERIKPKESRELAKMASAMLYLAKKTNQKKEEVASDSLELIKILPPIWLKEDILKSILENNILSKEQNQYILDDLPFWVVKDDTSMYHFNKELLASGIRFYQSQNKSPKLLFEHLAENENYILNEHQDDTDFLKFTTIGNKAMYLKHAGKLVESEKLFQEYTRLKKTVNLPKHSWELKGKEAEMFNNYINNMADVILKLPTESILAFFSENEDILVDAERNRERIKDLISNSVHMLFTSVVFDINSNFKELNESEKFDKEVISSYNLLHGFQCYSLFLRVFIDGMVLGKLNYYKVYQFLEKYTWYGYKFKRGMASQEIDDKVSWITMLAPGIHNFMVQFELSAIMQTNDISNFILAIDSMTLKFEGALRDFIRLSGGNTTIVREGRTQEQLMDGLLENETTKKCFSEKDIELFKFTFTKKGRNLRNKVAHSFMEFSDYNVQTASLVFLCILRLGKYSLGVS